MEGRLSKCRLGSGDGRQRQNVVQFEKHPRNRDQCTSALARCGHREHADWLVPFNVLFTRDYMLSS
jgi:hypothetical protein